MESQAVLGQGALTCAAVAGASRAPCPCGAPHDASIAPAGHLQVLTAAASAASNDITAPRSSALVPDSNSTSSSSSCSYSHHRHHQHHLQPYAQRHFRTAAPPHAAHPSSPGAAAAHDPDAAGGRSREAAHDDYSYDDDGRDGSHEYGHESSAETQEQDSQLDRDRALKRVLRSSNAAEVRRPFPWGFALRNRLQGAGG